MGRRKDGPRAGVLARFTMRSLARNRVRTAVTIAGVALACGLLTAVLVSVSTLRGGMLDRVRSLDGTWQVRIDAGDGSQLDAALAAMGDHLDRLAVQRPMGVVALEAGAAERGGELLSVATVPAEDMGRPRAAGDTAFEVARGPVASVGRLPQAPGEVALPERLRGEALPQGASAIDGQDATIHAEGPLELGSTVALAPATLRTTTPEGTYDNDPMTPHADHGEGVSSELVGVGEPRELVVVGFVRSDWRVGGSVAYVSADEPAMGPSSPVRAWASTTGYRSEDELLADVTGASPDVSAATNTSLLMYQGIAVGAAIQDTLVAGTVVLATVIGLGAGSLVRNAFAISVSERTRQFGLLASLGATRRQLRSTVLMEAGALGLVGVPLGLLLGLAGTWAAFAATSEGWAAILGTGQAPAVQVLPRDLACATLLSWVVLLLCALSPALRASRVSPVEALRQVQDVRPSRRMRRRLGRAGGAMAGLSADGRRPRGLAARLGGMPGFLAHRTHEAAGGRGRTAVLSLGVSVTLLVTAGLLGQYLGLADDFMDFTGSSDMEVAFAAAEPDGRPSEAAMAQALDGALLDRAEAVPGVAAASLTAQAVAVTHLDPACADWQALDRIGEESGLATVGRDGWGESTVLLVDAGTWERLAAEAGVDAGRARAAADPRTPGCLLGGTAYGTVLGSYATANVVRQAPGSVELLPESSLDGHLTQTDAGFEATRLDEWGDVESMVPLSQAGLSGTQVGVLALVDELPGWFPLGNRSVLSAFPAIVMPLSAWPGVHTDPELAAQDLGVLSLWASVDPDADCAAALDGVESVVEGTQGLRVMSSADFVEQARQNRAASQTVQVFLYLFTAIMAVMAVGNVFNTIASGMMLRTREFAALLSAGMGRRGLRRMVTLECLGLAARGLALGLVLSLLVDVALYRAVTMSFAGLVMTLPVGHVLTGAALSCAVLAIACAYALRRTRAMSLVNALRSEVM